MKVADRIEEKLDIEIEDGSVKEFRSVVSILAVYYYQEADLSLTTISKSLNGVALEFAKKSVEDMKSDAE